MIMTAADLLSKNAHPSDGEIRHALAGNYCRCTGYHNIVAAIREAADAISAGAGAEPTDTGATAGAAAGAAG
jgi:carbon-monoxide dehydrogenase small subunit